ncbi:DUF2795 domain-containing protein [Nocardia blacklockiae]|uniref:DUF2795 domain-containing protein n=1 Tax=Nocardia blacklockiae TaxID=480036 RepID=UPI0018960A27|nr:DUF2795 domain-containing protein [Nocardia blacklockiae]MBF6175322.1 DUF2795 domain-containing protein [Nocardia blacklockiae]
MSELNPVALQKYLHGVNYPCDRDGLVSAARDNGAGNDVINSLQKLPQQSYSGPDAVSKAVF